MVTDNGYTSTSCGLLWKIQTRTYIISPLKIMFLFSLQHIEHIYICIILKSIVKYKLAYKQLKDQKDNEEMSF